MKTTTLRQCIAFIIIVTVGFNVACKKTAAMMAGNENIEHIALLIDYETGCGGYIYPVYNPYVFFKNGDVVKEPYIPVNEINMSTITKDVASNWGKWQLNSNNKDVFRIAGRTYTEDE